MPGYELAVLDEDGKPVATNETGAIVIKTPLPPAAPGLWQNADGFQTAYLEDFPGYYKTGDAGFIDEDGYLYVMSRTDDIINVAGHRLSTGGMEEVLAGHSDIAECAVLGVNDALKGEVPLGFWFSMMGSIAPMRKYWPNAWRKYAMKLARSPLSNWLCAWRGLPKTRSGKNSARHDTQNRQWRRLANAGDH